MKTYKGWIRSIRYQKDLTFLSTYDGSQDLQVTCKKDTEIIGELKVGASFVAQGNDSITPRGLPEFAATSFEIVGKSDDDFVIQPKFHSLDFLRTVPESRGRTKQFQSVWKIRHHVSQAIHSFFEQEQFTQYFTPIITTSDCEGAGETFDVSCDWMQEKLTVSGQLYGEVGMMSLGKIYTFGPCFRAEKSKTAKHLSEFWMIEPEMAFYDLQQTIDLAEKFVKYVLQYVTDKCDAELLILEVDKIKLRQLIHKPWIKLRYVDICQQFGLEFGSDVSSDMEKKLTDAFVSPVFITHYPKDLKPFYMKKDEQYASCFDLIFPTVGELIGGSERESDYDKLKTAMELAKLDLEKMQWYLETRKHGSVPHAGFGLGLDRLVSFITGLKIHDVIPFPVSY